MTVDEIKEILELMREHELVEFELQRDGETIRLRKHSPAQWAGPVAAVPTAAYHPPVAPSGAAAAPQGGGDAPVLEPASEDVDLAIVKSPIVGTFYRSGEPGAPPFVEPGQTVKRGHVLCIIEAMKLMNEINAECDGEIVKVYVENGQAVQYGERLFAIRPS
jgi:acetyl-CoA carboxylase biotin carboxyl carrier protein